MKTSPTWFASRRLGSSTSWMRSGSWISCRSTGTRPARDHGLGHGHRSGDDPTDRRGLPPCGIEDAAAGAAGLFGRLAAATREGRRDRIAATVGRSVGRRGRSDGGDRRAGGLPSDDTPDQRPAPVAGASGRDPLDHGGRAEPVGRPEDRVDRAVWERPGPYRVGSLHRVGTRDADRDDRSVCRHPVGAGPAHGPARTPRPVRRCWGC